MRRQQQQEGKLTIWLPSLAEQIGSQVWLKQSDSPSLAEKVISSLNFRGGRNYSAFRQSFVQRNAFTVFYDYS